MLKHLVSLAVFTSRSQTDRQTHNNRKKLSPLTRSILWWRITNRSLLNTTSPQPKLTLTYWADTVGEWGILDLLMVFLTVLGKKTFFLLNSDAAWWKLKHIWTFGHSHTFPVLWGKKKKNKPCSGGLGVSPRPPWCVKFVLRSSITRDRRWWRDSFLTPAETQSGGWKNSPLRLQRPAALQLWSDCIL